MGIQTFHIVGEAGEIESWKGSSGIQEQTLTSPPEAQCRRAKWSFQAHSVSRGGCEGLLGWKPMESCCFFAVSTLVSLQPSVCVGLGAVLGRRANTRRKNQTQTREENVNWEEDKLEPAGISVCFSPITTSNHELQQEMAAVSCLPCTSYTASLWASYNSEPYRKGD